MAKMVQIRNMPDALHRKLRSRAAADGRSLSEYLLRLAERNAATPTLEEMLARLSQRTPARGLITTAGIIREARDRR